VKRHINCAFLYTEEAPTHIKPWGTLHHLSTLFWCTK